jgi:hypothetical protein
VLYNWTVDMRHSQTVDMMMSHRLCMMVDGVDDWAVNNRAVEDDGLTKDMSRTTFSNHWDTDVVAFLESEGAVDSVWTAWAVAVVRTRAVSASA